MHSSLDLNIQVFNPDAIRIELQLFVLTRFLHAKAESAPLESGIASYIFRIRQEIKLVQTN
jgi:hypothetical protein